ncbi:MAG: hypothetical protein PHX51_08510 [Clostridia bacterium]|nr:hypothetical protein [Clostridia bacterium]
MNNDFVEKLRDRNTKEATYVEANNSINEYIEKVVIKMLNAGLATCFKSGNGYSTLLTVQHLQSLDVTYYADFFLEDDLSQIRITIEFIDRDDNEYDFETVLFSSVFDDEYALDRYIAALVEAKNAVGRPHFVFNPSEYRGIPKEHFQPEVSPANKTAKVILAETSSPEQSKKKRC